MGLVDRGGDLFSLPPPVFGDFDIKQHLLSAPFAIMKSIRSYFAYERWVDMGWHRVRGIHNAGQASRNRSFRSHFTLLDSGGWANASCVQRLYVCTQYYIAAVSTWMYREQSFRHSHPLLCFASAFQASRRICLTHLAASVCLRSRTSGLITSGATQAGSTHKLSLRGVLVSCMERDAGEAGYHILLVTFGCHHLLELTKMSRDFP